MFEDFSFTSSAKGHRLHSFSSMDSSVSPTSSRGTTPSLEEAHTRRSSASDSMAELSEHFDRHHLGPQRPDFSPDAAPSRSRNAESSYRAPRNLNSSNHTSHLWQQRQALARWQRIPDRYSQTSTIHEDYLSGDRSYHNTPPSSSLTNDASSQSQWRTGNSHASSPFTPMPLSPPYSEEGEPSPAQLLRTQHTYKIGKEMRHCASRDAMPKQRVVLKKIRRRRSSLRKAAAAADRC